MAFIPPLLNLRPESEQLQQVSHTQGTPYCHEPIREVARNGNRPLASRDQVHLDDILARRQWIRDRNHRAIWTRTRQFDAPILARRFHVWAERLSEKATIFRK